MSSHVDGDLREDVTAFRRKHPELYGKLLEMDAVLQDAGGLSLFVYLLWLLFACCAVWFEWYHAVPGLQQVNLNSFWTYLILLVLAVFLFVTHVEWAERRCYRQHRQELLDLIGRARVNRYQLLTALEGDTAVQRAVAGLKRDKAAGEQWSAA